MKSIYKILAKVKKSSLLVVLCLLCSMAFIGCDSDLKDGDWDPIQVTVNGSECKSSIYKVATAGGEYKISSKNYGALWLNIVRENGKIVWHPAYDDRALHLKAEWYSAEFDNIGNIVVTIQSKEESAEPRSLTFDVERGDAFGHITLLQE